MGAKLSSKPDGGLKDALGLDQAADDLNNARAAAAENAGDEQLGLFAQESVFGKIVMPDGRELPRQGPGRPRGSLNRRTQALAEYAARLGGNPIIKLIEIVATPIDVISRTLACTKYEAAEFWRKCAADLGPYIEQKLPTAVQIQGANAGMLVINTGGPLGEQAIGLDLRVIAANFAQADALQIEHEQNQALSEDADPASHASPSHAEGK